MSTPVQIRLHQRVFRRLLKSVLEDCIVNEKIADKEGGHAVKLLLLTMLLILNGMDLYAHSGRTDSKGGHYNRKTGTYHYHGGGTSSTSSSSSSRAYTDTRRIADLEKQIDALEQRIRELEQRLKELEQQIGKPEKPATVQSKPADQYDENITVYGTKTGKKYHRAGCRYLSKSRIPYSSLKVAKALYSPCSVCKPPK